MVAPCRHLAVLAPQARHLAGQVRDGRARHGPGVAALAPGETVHINVLDAAHERHVRGLLSGVSGPVRWPRGRPCISMSSTRSTSATCAGSCRASRVPSATTASRPTTPAAVTMGRCSTRAGQAPLAAVDFAFNAWGGKYPPYDLDDAIPRRMDGPRHPAFPVNALLENLFDLAPGLAVPDYRAVAGIAWRTPPPSARWCYSSPTCAMKTATRSRPPSTSCAAAIWSSSRACANRPCRRS